MLETKLRKGVCINWRVPGALDTGRDGRFHRRTLAPNPLRYEGLAGDVSSMDPVLLTMAPSAFGLMKGVNIPHKWLDYRLGATARTRLAGQDVLTGFMSGCVIAMWTDVGGVRWVGHIGTIESDAAVNQRVKAHAEANMPANATGFDPSAAWPPGDRATAIINARKNMPIDHNNGGVPRVVALVTSGGAFFSILLMTYKSQDDYIVLGTRPVAPMLRAQLTARLT